jgi:hypothetical protein
MSSAADHVLRAMAIIKCKKEISRAQRGMAMASGRDEQEFLAYRGMLEDLLANLAELETT